MPPLFARCAYGGGGASDSVIALILSLIVATMFWTGGDELAAQLHDTFSRLGGATGDKTLDAAAGEFGASLMG